MEQTEAESGCEPVEHPSERGDGSSPAPPHPQGASGARTAQWGESALSVASPSDRTESCWWLVFRDCAWLWPQTVMLYLLSSLFLYACEEWLIVFNELESYYILLCFRLNTRVWGCFPDQYVFTDMLSDSYIMPRDCLLVTNSNQR